MEEVAKIKYAVAAAMRALETLLMDALEKNAREEGKPPEEWMIDAVSSSERLNHVWICLVCWWVTENAYLNLKSWSWVCEYETVCVSMVGVELKWGQGTENVEGVEVTPIPEVGWMNIPSLAMVALVVERWKRQFLS